MKTISSTAVVFAVAATFALGACTTTGGTTAAVPSDTASTTPPRLVTGATGISIGSTALAWDRPEAFGPVPAEMRAKGQAACDRLVGNGWAPTGYHALAQYADGSTSPTGGYYCRQG